MSYPSIGMPDLLPKGEKWNAATIEKLLRGGHHIYFDDLPDTFIVARFVDGKFQFTDPYIVDQAGEDKVIYENESFPEFAAWVAFGNRDFV